MSTTTQQIKTEEIEEIFSVMSPKDLFWTATKFILEVQNMEGFPKGTGLKDYDRAFQLQELAIQKIQEAEN